MGRWLLMNLHLSPSTPTVTPSVSPLSFRPRAGWHQEAPAATRSPTPCSNLIPAPPLPHWSPTSASPATQLCIQRLPSCCHRNPPQRHFCFSLFPPPPSHPPPWCLLSTPPWGGGGGPLTHRTSLVPAAPLASGGTVAARTLQAPAAPRGHPPLATSLCTLPSQGAGGPRQCRCRRCSMGCWCPEEQWAAVGSGAAFNPILPTWPRPQEEP